MGRKLSELEEGSNIILRITNENNDIQLDGTILKILKENVALISLDTPTDQQLIFDHVHINMEYHNHAMPVIWRDVKVIAYKNEYILQVFSEGVNYNRRNSFRVGISETATLHMEGRGSEQVLIKDISLSGFAIADRKKELNLQVGDKLSVHFEDWGHILNLVGQVVRVQEEPDITIYGLVICNLCKDLSSYINVKQRHKKEAHSQGGTK